MVALLNLGCMAYVKTTPALLAHSLGMSTESQGGELRHKHRRGIIALLHHSIRPSSCERSFPAISRILFEGCRGPKRDMVDETALDSKALA